MSRANPKVGFVSLGCPKALVDSERILTQLRAEGYAIVPSYDSADVVVVNTCGFIDAAVEESNRKIEEMKGQILAEKESVASSLRAEVAQLSAQIAEKVLGRRVA